MKKRNHLSRFIHKTMFLVFMMVLGILFFAGSSFQLDFKVTKKKNSLIDGVSNMADGAYSTFKTVKNFVK